MNHSLRTFRSTVLASVITLSLAIGWAFPVPGTADPAGELTKLTASDGAASDRFGVGSAVSGDTAVIGAPIEDGQLGAAYVYTLVGGTWIEQAKLVAPDRATTHKFGFSVALSGDTAVIGSSTAVIAGADQHAHPTPGTAHVFERVNGTWTHQATLTASDGAYGDDFGSSVAVSGDTVVVGGRGIDVDTNTDQGRAYVFARAGGAWSQQAKLTASDGAASDQFGVHVAISGDTAVVGAWYGDVDSHADQGFAYVFNRAGDAWTQQDKLIASDGAADDNFGFWVDVSGDTAVVGAVWDDVGDNVDQGSAYVFTRSGGTWSQQKHLIASDGAAADAFGRSVAIAGDTVVVGAQGADIGVNKDQGAAYVFGRTGGAWPEQRKLVASDGGDGDLFGVSVAMSGDTAVVGAPFQDAGTNTHQGGAYMWDSTRTVGGAERSVTLGLTGHLRAKGEVTSQNSNCRARIRVDIQKKSSRGWIQVASTTTDANGAFATRLRDRSGRHRAVVAETHHAKGTCLRAVSATVGHRH